MRKNNLKIILIITILFIISICTAKHVCAIFKTNKVKENKTVKLKHVNYPLLNTFTIPKVTSSIKEKTKEIQKPKYTEDELYWLAKIVYAEAMEDTDEGQQAVANVVLNRVSSSEFPNSIYKVIWQKTGKLHQFSPCADGGIKREPDKKAIGNAKIILEGKRLLPKDVLYFYMPTNGNKKNWIRNRKVYKKIGAHRFCY
jgi:N-acetylmuramoyl-L-alanine amidase